MNKVWPEYIVVDSLPSLVRSNLKEKENKGGLKRFQRTLHYRRNFHEFEIKKKKEKALTLENGHHFHFWRSYTRKFSESSFHLI